MKNLLYVLMFFGLTNLLNAQQTDFGVRVGSSFTNFDGIDRGGSSFGVWFHGGAFVSIGISNNVVFEPALLFARKGAINTGLTSKWSARNDYLDIPLVLKGNVSEVLFVFFGIQPSLLIKPVAIIDDGSNRITVGGDEIRDLYKEFDFAGIIGLGFNLPLGLSTQVSYEHGFTSIFENGEIFNRGIKLSLSKLF
ncbi:outer membrane beta-barrel protein [Pleomorphovibrio marinus]|uniref:outer membrane beta-barrel protein n=1 Tax=Pleomorphovibrio marinus TaxID=2164132 RepID=UPI000E0BB064|nr:outer membrane beta-barrel protein [Pleomorphovibrio marinus]